MSNIFLRLVDSNAKIEKDINNAISIELNKRLKKNRRRVEKKVKIAVASWINQAPEMQSLREEGVFYSLNAQLGFPLGFSDKAVSAIVDAVVGSVGVNVNGFFKSLQGGITFTIQPENFANLLGLSEANLAVVGGQLPWLEWLLLQGGKTIITGYEYEPSKDGRSGGGVMVLGGAWRIPPQFAGTQDDNFITRALSGREKELSVIMQGLLA